MNLTYKTSTAEGSLRTIHTLEINGELIATTRNREVLLFAKPRIDSKIVWKHLKEAVRLGESLEVAGGK